ncbi:MAG TPA: OadG family protein [Nitrospinota bacterium]|jgi:Na+-transporting methylmalonyl-CoA/oxaloacetate decarboxylase gamma subunit|nr:OadG family protein [Nitrospinota bacterium]
MTLDINSGIKNIVEGQGVDIAITGMVIVFIALGLITLSIAFLPKILKIIAKVFPESATTGVSGEFAAEEDNVLAAIGFALHKRITKDPYAK